ncbi:DUF305 domain-containing protein [Paraburkholderia sp.]|uniref:DUF305 domain-containing protein n=1 Tax=Paraburkholderia sp. TaxID=1926495 RepID=UPI0025ED9FBB|nr:DUF305 domain-containing protein [Paraburkholderia sp.]
MLLSVVIVLTISALCGSPAFAARLQTTASDEAPFLAENNTAMTTMMDGMAVKPTGDVDRDFVALMVPHHQGAIDMAQAELRYGHNEQLRRIAQEIVVEQQQEIVAMRVALGQALPPPAPAPDQQKPAPKPAAPAHPGSGDNMQMNMLNPMREDQ